MRIIQYQNATWLLPLSYSKQSGRPSQIRMSILMLEDGINCLMWRKLTLPPILTHSFFLTRSYRTPYIVCIVTLPVFYSHHLHLTRNEFLSCAVLTCSFKMWSRSYKEVHGVTTRVEELEESTCLSKSCKSLIWRLRGMEDGVVVTTTKKNLF